MTAPGTFDRRLVMGIVVGAIVPAFALTQLIVSQYRHSREGLAVEWSERGQRDAARDPEQAVSDFETALAFGPDRASDRFALAKALVAARRSAEARAQLVTLSDEKPGDGSIQLELARIAANAGDLTAAVRDYDEAIDGAWEINAGASRRGARLELARLLMSRGQSVHAQAELIAMIGDLPADPELIIEVGQLLVEAGAPSRALGLFERATELNPTDGRGPLLAGEVQFRAGDLPSAHRYLVQAEALGPLDADARDMLGVSGRVLALDPYADGIGARARADRALRALEIAKTRVDRCQTGASDGSVTADLSARIAAKERLGARALARDADAVDDAVAVAFEAEKLPDGSCGGASLDDRALALIARRRAVPPQ